jgi:hypothetical protein
MFASSTTYSVQQVIAEAVATQSSAQRRKL